MVLDRMGIQNKQQQAIQLKHKPHAQSQLRHGDTAASTTDRKHPRQIDLKLWEPSMT